MKNVYDIISPILFDVFQSHFLNLGCWAHKSKDFSEGQRALVRLFGEFSELKKDLKILDVGCGTGEGGYYYLSIFPTLEITGIDSSKTLIEMAKKKGQKQNVCNQIDFICQDVLNRNHQWTDSSFDRILALECSYHFTNKQDFLKMVYPLLKNGGILSIAEPLLKDRKALEMDYWLDIQGEIPDGVSNHEYFRTQLAKKIGSFLKNEILLIQENPNYNLPWERHPTLFRDIGFEAMDFIDMTEEVIGFYAPLKQRILNLLETDRGDLLKTDVLLTLFSIFYFRFRSFQDGTAGYYFMKARKGAE